MRIFEMSKKTKVYKNPERDTPENVKKYVPQYKQKNIEPEQVEGATANNILIAKVEPDLPLTNPRSRRSPVRQPYADTVSNVPRMDSGYIPNVGNNMEHTWSSIDGEITDDISQLMIDENQPMIDNNEVPSDEVMRKIGNDAKSFVAEKDLQKMIESQAQKKQSFNGLQDLEEDQYLILIDNQSFAIGSFEFIQHEVKALVFGEHDFCQGNPVPIENIMVIKRVSIKIGVFLG